MDIANSLLQLVNNLWGLANNLWGLASRHLGYIRNLKDNVRSLEEAKNNLKAVRTRVEREGGGGAARRKKEVENWLGKVQDFEDGVDQVLREAEERERINCLSRCLPRNCWSSYRLGKRVDLMLKGARVLQTEGENLGTPKSPLSPPPVLKLPLGETVGLDISLNEVLKLLVDKNQVRPIGLYGPGGVGKTTLMKRLNNELSNHGFDVVIWSVVSKPVNEDSIRDDIRKRLDIQDENWDRWSPNDRVHHLYDALIQKKFVLLIDDIWERLELPNIVPPDGLENGSKVVFTTRSENVCHQMGALMLEVRLLTPEEALKLFEKKVGTPLVDFPREIRKLVEDIAEECKALPLALTIVGRAMAGKVGLGSWRHALKTLRNRPHELSGMEEEVYHILQYSYESLKGEIHKTCFLYCCLFPEDYLIRTDRLIELWIGEGLLRGTYVRIWIACPSLNPSHPFQSNGSRRATLSGGRQPFLARELKGLL